MNWRIPAGFGLILVGTITGCTGDGSQTKPDADKGDKAGKTGSLSYKTDVGTTSIKRDASGQTKMTTVDKKGEKSIYETIAKLDPRELGLDIYPGAEQVVGEGGASKRENSKAVEITAAFTTSDSPGTVASFYKERLIHPSVPITGADSAMVSGKNVAGDEVVVAAQVQQSKGVTEIRIVVTKRKKS